MYQQKRIYEIHIFELQNRDLIKRPSQLHTQLKVVVIKPEEKNSGLDRVQTYGLAMRAQFSNHLSYQANYVNW